VIRTTVRRSVLGAIGALAAFGAEAAPVCEAPAFRGDGGPRAATAGGAEPAPGARALRAEGNVHLLVLLAAFADLPARIDPSRFHELLFGPERSVRDYWREATGGRLDVTGEILGWMTLPGRQIDYSDRARGTGTYPRNAQKMAEDAVDVAIAGGLDLARFDADADGVVDALLVVHSGQGWEWAGATGPGSSSSDPDPDSINSHKWITVKRDFAAGKPRVVDYFTCPELMLVRQGLAVGWSDSISTIGVYCHEFGHVLGLPDFYDTDTGENHVGVWELMDYGTWNRIANDPASSAPGAVPSHPSAWSKTFLRSIVPVDLAPGVGEALSEARTLASASLGGPPAQILANPFGVDWTSSDPGTGEYFLAEVRTLDGYDAGLPSAGLLLYHVDEGQASNRGSSSPGPRRLLRLLAQDDSTSHRPNLSVADPWPGAQITFGAASAPSSALYDATPSGVTLENIAMNADSSVSFTAVVTNLSSAVPLPFARPNPWRPSAQGDARIVVSLDPGGSVSAEVVVLDVRGRRVRVLGTSDDVASQGRIAVWDGRDDRGRPLPAGVYFFRVPTRSGSGKVTLVR